MLSKDDKFEANELITKKKLEVKALEWMNESSLSLKPIKDKNLSFLHKSLEWKYDHSCLSFLIHLIMKTKRDICIHGFFVEKNFHAEAVDEKILFCHKFIYFLKREIDKFSEEIIKFVKSLNFREGISISEIYVSSFSLKMIEDCVSYFCTVRINTADRLFADFDLDISFDMESGSITITQDREKIICKSYCDLVLF